MQNKSENISAKNAEYCVLDLETTGQSARNSRIIEIGIVRVKQNKILDVFQTFVNPGEPIPFFITQLTGITTYDVKDAPYFEDIKDDLIEFLGDSILVAHNLKFDYSFLKAEFLRVNCDMLPNKTLCSLKLARKLYPNLSSKSLGALVKYFRIRQNNAHRALSDASATAQILLKMIKKAEREYEISDTKELLRFQNLPSGKKYVEIKDSLKDSVAKMPDHPGVYFFKNSKGKILYIGKAKSLSKRIRSYFSKHAGRKAGKIVKAGSKLEHKKTNSELTALLTEAELIKKHNPRLNSQLKKFSQTYFVRVNLVKDFPDIKVTSIFDFNGNDYFGPYANRETAKTLVDIVNKTFKIRECTEKDFKKARRCYLADIERCYAPCSEEIDNEYDNELDQVYDFLSGKKQDAVDRLLGRMKMLSDLRKYEAAADLRDTVQNILNQINRSSILSEPINKANILLEIKDTAKLDYILMLKGKVIVKDEIFEEHCRFMDVLEDYFSGTIGLFEKLEERDLERVKIVLSWLVKNKERANIYYLNDYESKEDIAAILKRKW